MFKFDYLVWATTQAKLYQVILHNIDSTYSYTTIHYFKWR